MAQSRLLLVMEDSGGTGSGDRAEHAQSADSGLGIGLSNTKERLKNLYGSDSDLTVVSSVRGGVRFEISIPVMQSWEGGAA